MHPRELLVGGERRFIARKVRSEAGSDELVFDRGETRGPLGMVRAHVVLQAIGMGDESRAHAFSSYPISYNRRMLLKAEFQQPSVSSAPIERVIGAASNIILGKET